MQSSDVWLYPKPRVSDNNNNTLIDLIIFFHRVKLLSGKFGEDGLSQDEVYNREKIHSSKKKKNKAGKEEQTEKPVIENGKSDVTDRHVNANGSNVEGKLGKKRPKVASSTSGKGSSQGALSEKRTKGKLIKINRTSSQTASSPTRADKNHESKTSKISSQASGKGAVISAVKNSESKRTAEKPSTKKQTTADKKQKKDSSNSSSTSSSDSDSDDEPQSQPQIKSQVNTMRNNFNATSSVVGNKPSLPIGTSAAKKVNPKDVPRTEAPKNGVSQRESSESESSDSESDSSDSESSSTDEDAVNKKRNVLGQKMIKQGPSSSPKVVHSLGKRPGSEKSESPAHSSIQNKMINISLQSQKLMVSSSVASPSNLQPSRNGLNRPVPSSSSATRKANVTPSQSKSAGGHVRFSSDSDSDSDSSSLLESNLNDLEDNMCAKEAMNAPAQGIESLSAEVVNGTTEQRDLQAAIPVPNEVSRIDENCPTPTTLEGQVPTELVKEKVIHVCVAQIYFCKSYCFLGEKNNCLLQSTVYTHFIENIEPTTF